MANLINSDLRITITICKQKFAKPNLILKYLFFVKNYIELKYKDLPKSVTREDPTLLPEHIQGHWHCEEALLPLKADTKI